MHASSEGATSTPRLLRRPEVQARIGLSCNGLYLLIAAGKFPRPVRISSRAVAWLESEVSAWIDARVVERDSRQAA